MRRVVVTGLGAVSPFGAGVKAFWTGIATGSCAIRPITLIETDGFRCQIAAEVPDGIAGSLIRKRANGSGFTEEELDREFVAFRGEFERSLYRD